jgi:protein O-GlcNAc transferase
MSRRHARAAAKSGPVRPHHPTAPQPAPGTFQQAWAAYAGGDRATAESLCRAILARQGDDVGAMSLLGIILAQSRRAQEACDLLAQVAARMPQDPGAHNNYGNVLRDLGRYLKALSSYDRAIVLRPDYAEAHYNRGVTLHDLQRHDEALASYNRAVALEPGHAAAWSNRGATLRALGLRESAVESFERALALRPAYPEAHNGRGVALQEIDRFEEALASYERAIACRADYAEAHNNRGIVLLKLQRPEEALASLERALALRSDYAEAYSAHGAVLKELERFEEALASFDRAIAIRPDYAEAYSNRGSVLRALRRYPEALASYERALEIDPNFADAHRNQGAAFIDLKSFDQALASYERALALNQDTATYVAQGAVLHELKRTDEAIASYQRALALDPEAGFLLGTLRHVRMQICDWTDLETDIARITAGLEADRPLCRPFNFLSLVDSPRLQRRASELAVSAEIMPRRKLPPISRQPRHERIRVGYFSADLRNHPVTILTAELFELHDRSRFDITAFSLGPNVHDEFRARIEPAFDRFLWVGGQSDGEIAELSRRLGIDIAVDLGGYTGDGRARHIALRAELSRLSRHQGRRVHGLPARRPDHRATRGACALHGEDRLPAELSDQRLETGHWRSDVLARGARIAGNRVRILLFQRQLQDQPADLRQLDEDPLGGTGQCALPPGRRRHKGAQLAPAGSSARYCTRASRLRRKGGERGVPRPVSQRRPLPRHASLQRRDHGERCALGGLAGADLHRAVVRGTGRGEHPGGRRSCRAGHPGPGSV